MDRSLKIAGWVLVAIVAFWLVLQIVGAIFSFVSWLVSMVLTLALVGILLYAGYILVSKLIGSGSSSSGSTSRERERIFE